MKPRLPVVPIWDGAVFGAWVRACGKAELEESRAARAAAIAARHEQFGVEGSESLRHLHRRMAATYRRSERVHRRTAAIHRAYANRFFEPSTAAPGGLLGPELLVTIAGELGVRGVALTLLGSARYEESAVASDAVAAAAQELEFTLGEGPAHEAAKERRLLMVHEEALPARWARYSPAVTELGVHSVAAAPLCVRSTCFGVLTAFDPSDNRIARWADEQAKVLAGAVLVAMGETGAGTEWLLSAGDDRTVVHQATGMVAERLRCSTADALAVLRARAFAENEAVGTLARRVVDRQYVFE